MLNKILLVIVLGFFAGLASADAQTAPAAKARVKGQIVAARVQGHVEAISTADGKARVLKDGDALSEGMRVVTSEGSSVILVFSNGATVSVASDSNLDIDQFDQDPFASPVKMSDLKGEEGTSTTRLNLTKGELVGRVVHLNVDRGSEFTVQTPVGAAGIRGTTFKIIFRPGPNGTTRFVVVTSEGVVVFRGTTSAPITVPAGKSVVATFTVTPSTGTGTTPTATVTTTDTSPSDEAEITTVVQTITDASTTVIFQTPTGGGGNGGKGNGGNGGNGGNNGNGGNDSGNTPSGAAQPTASTTPLSGTT